MDLFRFCFLSSFLIASLHSQTVPDRIDSLRSAIAKVFEDPLLKNARGGFFAKSLTTGQILHQKNPDSLFSTASCLKLVTTAAALDRWGTDHQFRTEFRYDGTFRDSVISGDLHIKGFGDPYFLPEILLRAVYHLKAMGLREVKGDIVGDDRYLADSENAETNDRAYSAVGGALGFNFNIVNIFVQPGKRVGDSAVVFVEPVSKLISVVNGVKTSDSGSGIGVNHNNTFARYRDGKIVVSLFGTIGLDEGEFAIYKRAENPTMWTLINIKETMEMMGIRIRGRIRVAGAPKDSKLLIDPPSYNLSYIVAGVNKWSNNYVAGQLLMIMGAEAFGEPGTDEKGIRAIQPFLRKAGIAPNEITMVDGSGLDERDRMTPRAQVKLLEFLASHPHYGPEFMASLSIGGVDGTEKKRFKRPDEEPLIGNSRLKVGFLYGVSGLSGYLSTRTGQTIAFCILTNGYPKEYYESIRRLEDRICKILSEW